MHASCPKKEGERRKDNNERTESTPIDIVSPVCRLKGVAAFAVAF
jgi:hypothetical protein